MRPTIAEAAEIRAQEAVDGKLSLLRAMRAAPDATQREWAAAIGRSLGTVANYLRALKADRLAAETLGRWSLTKAAREFLNANARGE